MALWVRGRRRTGLKVTRKAATSMTASAVGVGKREKAAQDTSTQKAMFAEAAR